jgi:hypothetical protein
VITIGLYVLGQLLIIRLAGLVIEWASTSDALYRRTLTNRITEPDDEDASR